MGSGERLERGESVRCALPVSSVIYVWPLGMAQQDYHSHNKTHIVQLSIWIWYFYLLWPNQAELNRRADSDIKVFSMAEGKVGCPCLMCEQQKGTSVQSSKRRIRGMNVSVHLNGNLFVTFGANLQGLNEQ